MAISDRLQIGIVGTGGRGVDAFGAMLQDRDDAVISALADPNPERLRQAQLRLDAADAGCYSSIEAMLDAESGLDGVIITSPDFAHEANALAAIAAGQHILVDKPLAITAEGCARIIAAAKARQREVAVGFNLRHIPVIAQIKALIDAGEIGRLMLIENREFYDLGRTYMARWNRHYDRSGGLWVHKGSHDFDIFNWWNSTGTPVRVSAFAGLNALTPQGVPFVVDEDKPVGPTCTLCAYRTTCPDCAVADHALFNERAAAHDDYVKDLCIYTSDKDTHDNGIAIVEYDNGVRASHLECFIANFTDRLYTVVGDRGTIFANLENPESIELRPRWGNNRTIAVPPAAEGGHGGSDPQLLDHFLHSIRTGNAFSSTSHDGLRAVAVGQAAEIAWRQRRLVEIEELIDLEALRSTC